MPNVAESFLRGHQQALSEQQQAQDQVERQIRQKVLQQQLAHEKLSDLISKYETQFKASQNIAGLTGGQPLSSYGPADIQGGTLPSAGLGLGSLPAVQAPTQLTPVPVPGLPELGIPATSIPRQPLEQIMAAQARQKRLNEPLVSAGPGTTIFDPATNRPIYANAADRTPPPLPQQLLDALRTGDQQKAALIQETMRIQSTAGQDPVQHALLLQQAQDRLDAEAQKTAPVDITAQIQTPYLGHDPQGNPLKYVDSSQYKGEDYKRARVAAEAAGVPFVAKDMADSIGAADRAAITLGIMWKSIDPLLPKDASGRLLGGPQNTLGKLFQSNPTLGSFQSWRTAAVQAVQALAEKGMGLRLNQSEINNLLEGLPKITDTAPVAQSKMDILNSQLETKVITALTKNRSTLAPQTLGKISVTAPDGSVHPFDTQAQADAFKKLAGIK